MRSNGIIALTGFLGVVAAVPFAGQHHQRHQHHRRVLVWETVTQEVIQTIPVTKTVWLEPGETPPTASNHYVHPEPPAYSSASSPVAPASSPAPPAYTPPVQSSPVSSPAPPAYTPPAYSTPSSSSVYVAPTTPSSSYVAPVPTSTYVPPPAPVTPSSSYVAPAPSSAAPAPSSSAPSTGGGLTSGMAKAGTYYTGDLTWYQVGLGACGITSSPDQHIVAVAESIFDSYSDAGNPNNNPLCNKKVTITGVDGSTYPATIVDRCTGCKESDRELSQDFFNLVTSNGAGRVSGMKWCFD